MKVLILGGTGFLGRHVAEDALARGHEVTVFHRGRSNPGILAEAEHVIGDRERDLSGLSGRRFDVVVDPGGYEVGPVRAAARAVRHPGVNYVFVSSISVYADFGRAVESAEVRALADAETAKLSLETYGGLKAACEKVLEEELPGRVLHVRAGLILGPHDYDARFRYWLLRMARGGEVLAPGDAEAPAQAIDARDLAAWMMASAEGGTTGVFNATGPVMTMRSLLETLRDVVSGNVRSPGSAPVRLTWVPDEVLLSHAVRPFSEMPFWLPTSLGARPVDISRALAAGLSFRPFAETARDTWEWLQTGWDAEVSVRENRTLRVPGGMAPEREAAILEDARRASKAA